MCSGRAKIHYHNDIEGVAQEEDSRSRNTCDVEKCHDVPAAASSIFKHLLAHIRQAIPCEYDAALANRLGRPSRVIRKHHPIVLVRAAPQCPVSIRLLFYQGKTFLCRLELELWLRELSELGPGVFAAPEVASR
jgi:hypothetical protein